MGPEACCCYEGRGSMPHNSQTTLEESPLRFPPKPVWRCYKKDGECGLLHLQKDHGHTDAQSSTDGAALRPLTLQHRALTLSLTRVIDSAPHTHR